VTPRAQTFIVRIWFESTAQSLVWRATVTNANTQERRFFSSSEGLTAFLIGSLDEPEPAQTDPRTPTALEDA
jgi:hypothetical protein